MDLEFFILISIVLIFAAFVHGSIGFGFALIPTPLIALFTDMQTAILLTLLPTLLVNLVSFLSESNIKEAIFKFMPIAIITMIGSAIGTQILIVANSDIFKLILAISILLYLFTNNRNISISVFTKYPKTSFIIYPFFTGIVGGLTNVMGPMLMIYGIELKYTKAQFIQMMNLCFLLGKVIQIFIFFINDSFTKTDINFSLITIFIISFSLYYGIKVKKRIDSKLYIKLIKILLLIISIILIVQYIYNLYIS
ncbi:sulfite exporter TauE/SafE family protein [Arcobacter sp. CECT 8985]|uniref:sulfite exporter TauE/SafE family protein n=1 Tax=Arcobacter sp. CECT 8985 TaxID=1935424 RepID=UPI0013E92319|nr:sulfite exporter TauE/SafE family protein [Arcobacter sp. CECT 8985]